MLHSYLELPPAYHVMCQPYEILRAIERKDIMFLMEVRDRSFEVSFLQFTSILSHLEAVPIPRNSRV